MHFIYADFPALKPSSNFRETNWTVVGIVVRCIPSRSLVGYWALSTWTVGGFKPQVYGDPPLNPPNSSHNPSFNRRC